LPDWKVVVMVEILIAVICVWMLVLNYFILKLAKASKVHERHIFEMTSKIRGLKLAVKILGARRFVDAD